METMSCEGCADRLGEFVDGRLTDDVRAALMEHLASCAACGRLIEGYVALPDLLRRATGVQMPYDVEVRLRRAVAAALARTHRTPV